MTPPVSYARRGKVGVITVDNPPVNALGHAVRQGLVDALETGLADDGAIVLVLHGAGRTFMAGADIREFGKPPAPPDLNSVIDRYEAAAKPIVAAIHGTALGGGLELAMGCHFRVAVPDARLGLPEVKLGILPGAGGTQRLPRAIGVAHAVDMITSGEPIGAREALKRGLVHEVVDGDLLAGAVAFAESAAAEGRPITRLSQVAVPAGDHAATFAAARKRIAERMRGQFAPERCIRAIEGAVSLPFAEGRKRERELFVECLGSPHSAALRHAFFAERQASHIPDIPRDTPVRPIARAAVIGCGTMGGGIAMCFANAGIPVSVVESSAEALERGLGVIRRNYEVTVSRGRLTQDALETRMGLIAGTTDWGAIRQADIVIEAVFEEMDVKKDVFRRLDGLAKADAILATNTSTLDVDEIASVTKRPAAVLGLHFFSPANVMRLLEVVRGRETAKDVLATSMGLGKRIGKVPVMVGVCDGFVGNRMLHAYTRQAQFVLEEGALPEQVDKAIYDFGFAMGPFAVGDLAGLDIGWRIRQRRAKDRPSNQRYSPIADRLCEQGRFGQKTGAGWYRYETGSRAPIPDPAVAELIRATAAELGIAQRSFTDEEIVKRCLYPLVNEGARILEEGIALRPSDIDVIYLYGYGFPAWRGGPMFWADQVGLDRVLADIRRFHAEHGELWAPAPLLERLVAEGRRFADLKSD